MPETNVSDWFNRFNVGLSPMSCRHFSLAIIILSLLTMQNAFAFRCGNDLVVTGDSKLSVANKCGQPDWVDRWSEEVIDFPDTDFERRAVRINERWLYNPGPRQFIRIITFNGSTVSAIETAGRGFIPASFKGRCDFDSLSLGASPGVVAGRCGEPDAKEQRYESASHSIPGGRRRVSVTVDEWTFNLGPTHFMRILTFRNGELIEIRTGEKGFR